MAIGAAVAAGVAAVLLHRESPALAAPPVCADAADMIGALAARVFRDAPAGLWWLRANGVLTAVAVAALALTARAMAVSWPAAIAAALAFGLLPRFSPVVAPAAPATSALAALTLFALVRLGDATLGDSVRWRWRALAWGGLALTALFLPSAILPAVIAIVAVGLFLPRLTSSRRSRGLGAVVAVATVALVLAMGTLAPHLPPSLDASPSTWACMLPVSGAAISVAHVVSAVSTHLVAPAGIYALALAALGAFVLWLRRDVRLAVVMTYAVVVGAAVLLWSDQTADALAPAVVSLWLLTAVGLEETLRQCRRGPGGRLAAALLVALLPGLPFVRPAPRLPAEWTPFGQESLSRQSMQRVLGAMPDGAVLVRDDAMTDVLLRSLADVARRTGKSLRVVDRDSAVLAAEAARADSVVYALPSTSSVLPLRAFALSDGLLPGLARVRRAGSCDAITAGWRALSSLASSRTFAVVAAADASHGPIVLYVASDTPFAAQPIDWPGATTRGFSWDVFDRAPDGSESAREGSFAEDAALLQGVWLDAPHVARLELWRTPDAPLDLGVDLGTTPVAAMARVRPDAGADQHVSVCTMTRYTRVRIDR
jgi:hypothetical protein